MRLNWVAEYDNGERVYQVDPVSGVKNSYEGLDRKRIRSFSLWDEFYKIRYFYMLISPHERWGWRRRVAMHSTGEREIGHVIGKEGAVVVVFEADGRIDFKSGHDGSAWFGSPEWREGEG